MIKNAERNLTFHSKTVIPATLYDVNGSGIQSFFVQCGTRKPKMNIGKKWSSPHRLSFLVRKMDLTLARPDYPQGRTLVGV